MAKAPPRRAERDASLTPGSTGVSIRREYGDPEPLAKFMNLGNRLIASLFACLLAGCATNSSHPYVVNEVVTNTVPSLVDSLLIGNKAGQTGVVFVTSGTLRITNGTLAVGPVGHGELHISGGEITAREVKLGGKASTASGMLHLTGGKLIALGRPDCDTCGFSQNDGEIDGGELDVGTAAIMVGQDHDAQLNVRNGNVKAGNLYVGYSDGFTGTMALSGGTVEVNSNLTIASASKGANGVMLVSGGVLGVRNGRLAVGPIGHGELDISGGEVIAQEVKLGGRNAGAFGLLHLTNGKLTALGRPDCKTCGFTANDAQIDGGELDAAAAAIVVGQDHDAQLSVRNGIVRAHDLYIGFTPGFTGTMALSGGTVEVNSDLTIGSTAHRATGIMSVSGGALNVRNGSLTVGPIGRGELNISNGEVIAQEVKLGGRTASASGMLRLTGGKLHVLGKPDCKTCGFSSNDAEIDGGELDASTASIVVGQNHDAQLNIRSGTVWAANLYVGYSPGLAGTMTISGGAVSVGQNFLVGDSTSNAVGNVTLSQGQIFVTNAAHNATLEIRKGSLTLKGDARLVVDTLITTNASAHLYREGGTLTCGTIIGKSETPGQR